MQYLPIHGRGASFNPPNRFERLSYEPDPEWQDPDEPDPWRTTQYFRDAARTVLTRNNSPDVPFDVGLNPYRGCSHGCAYCFARPNHEYLGLSAGLDFESKIFVKLEAPELLRAELSSPRWNPEPIIMSGVTDPYQPAERRFRITRGCLEVLAEFRNPIAIITKNHLVTRDVDLLAELASHQAAIVNISITSLDPKLQRVMEPRTSIPKRRLAAVETLSRAGVPVNVMVAPVIPGLNDHEVPSILSAAAAAGARSAGFIPLRLPGAVAEIFQRWLSDHFPERKERVLNRIREIRGGRLNDPRFGSRMRGSGPYWEQMRAMFQAVIRREGLDQERPSLSTAAFRRPDPGGQLRLFSEP
ncbi:MAG TPA: PA0069 family radical SAM protein [Longimicrobiaceae bacterium]